MGFLDDLNASIQVHHHLRRLGRQVESIFAEIHSRVEQEADGEEGSGTGGAGGTGGGAGGERATRANRASGATNRISESRR